MSALCPMTLLNLLISFSSLVDSFGQSTYTIMWSVNNQNFIFSNLYTFYFLFIALCMISRILLSTSGKKNIIALFLIWGERINIKDSKRYGGSYRFFIDLLFSLVFSLSLLKFFFFNHTKVLNFCTCWNDNMIFSFLLPL